MPEERLIDHRDRQLGRDRTSELIDGLNLELDRVAWSDERFGRRDGDAQLAFDLDVEIGAVELIRATSAWK